ncbi:MAG: MFS transporter [Deltaproteobacteria bacterium]|nr:MFS transporter [Deltaproteobacteria bacterium]
MSESKPHKSFDDSEASQRAFFVLWTGQALSLLGSQAVQFALIWWLTLETGSAAMLATATLLGLLPQAVLGPVIGVLVDRWNRKRILFWADASVALASVTLAGLFAFGVASTGHVLALLLVRAMGAAFHGPAMLASTSLMVREDLLAKIQGLNQGLQGGLLILSAPLGAFLVSWVPMAGVMVVDVATAAFALIPLIFIRVPQPASNLSPGSKESNGQGAVRSLLAEMAAGFSYLRERGGHLALLGLATMINLCMVPAFSLLPLLVQERGGDAGLLGWMTALFGVGMLVGGTVLATWGGFQRRMLTSMTFLLGLGLATLALSAAPAGNSAASLAAIFAVGFMVPLVNGPIQAVLQATVAPEFQGRVFTLYGSLATLAAPLGLLLAAPIADFAGITSWYLAGGVTCLVMGCIGLGLPMILQLEDSQLEDSQLEEGSDESSLAESAPF